jgi:hypothetical protein
MEHLDHFNDCNEDNLGHHTVQMRSLGRELAVLFIYCSSILECKCAMLCYLCAGAGSSSDSRTRTRTRTSNTNTVLDVQMYTCIRQADRIIDR